MTDFATLVLDANTNGLERGERRLRSLGSEAAETSHKVAVAAHKIGVGLTKRVTAPIVAAGVAFTAGAHKIAEDSKEIANAATLAGEGFEEFQRQAFAAKKVGIEVSKLGDMFKDVRERVGEFIVTGGGPLTDAFEALNGKVRLSVDELRGLSGKDALGLIVKRMQEAKLSTEEMSFVLESLGSDATALLPLLLNNAKAFEELGKGASVISKEDAADLKAYADAQDKFGQAIQTLTVTIASSGLLDTITEVIEGFANVASRLGDTNPALLKAGVIVAGVAAATGPLLVGLSGILSLAPAVAAGFAAMSVPLAPLIPLALALAAAGVLIYENWDTIGGALSELGAGLGLVKTEFQQTVSSIGTGFQEISDAAVSGGFKTKEEAEKIRQALNSMSAEGAVDPAITLELTELTAEMEKAGHLSGEQAEEIRSNILKAWSNEDVTREKSDWELLGEEVLAFNDVMTGVAEEIDATNRTLRAAGQRHRKFISDSYDATIDYLSELPGRILAFLGGIADTVYQTGKDIISGLVSGIKANASAVWNALMNVATTGVNQVKEFLGIQSPSRLFMEIGGFISEGLAVGIEGGKELISPTIDSLGGWLTTLQGKAETVTSGIAVSFKSMAHNVLSALDRVVGAIQGGGFLNILGSVIDLGLQLGSAGVFGKGIQNRLSSFSGGGSTGNGARSGGLDGQGGFLAMMHPQETVIDHFRGQAQNDNGGQRLAVTVTMDPSTGQLGAFVRNEAGHVVAAAAPTIAEQGANLANSRTARAQRRAVR